MSGRRVLHASTGAPGTATHEAVLTPELAGDLAGPWSFVRFDDGLECWCPDAALLPAVAMTIHRDRDGSVLDVAWRPGR